MARRVLAFAHAGGEAKRAFVSRRSSVPALATPARLPCACVRRSSSPSPAPARFSPALRDLVAAAAWRAHAFARRRGRRRRQRRRRIRRVGIDPRATPAFAAPARLPCASCARAPPLGLFAGAGKFLAVTGTRAAAAAWRVFAFGGAAERAFAPRRFSALGYAVPARLPRASCDRAAPLVLFAGARKQLAVTRARSGGVARSFLHGRMRPAPKTTATAKRSARSYPFGFPCPGTPRPTSEAPA
jgi:hypothetical protein